MPTSIESIHIIGTRILGGAESFFARLVNALNADGYRTMAIVRPASELPTLLDPDVPVERVGMWNGADVFSMLRIRRLVRQHRPAVVQTYMGRASRLTRLGGSNAVAHVARLGGYYRPASYRHADMLVGNTRGICDYLVDQGFARERVDHIGNFVTPPRPAPTGEGDALRRKLDVAHNALVVFSLGRFITKKGFVDLLDAFAAVPSEVGGRPTMLVLAGDGALREELEARAESLGIAARVHWLGWVREPDPYFRLADLFVCPSLHEPLGNVILEAWNHGLPVISTRTKGALELIEPDVTGSFTDISDPAGLTSAIRSLAESPEKAQAMGQAGLEMVRARHSPEVVVGAYRELYRRVSRS